jgi:serine/threonine protein kinase
MSTARRRFRFIKEIAEGGFGKVYLAEQLSADGFSRIVAVKLLHAKWSSHDEVVMRTRDEARLLGLIRHQHIVKVEDLSSIDGKCAIVMEYLEGVDLKCCMQFLRERNQIFPRAALFETMLGVVSALDAAYNGLPLQGGAPLKVIHRDIKPSNIFLTIPGLVKVLDFGTARANFAEREAKTQALAFGSQGYMAPERMLGEEDTPAADIFSLGVTLYELLTFESFGRIPPRPNKFLAKVQDRVASVQLDGDPEWQEQVRETLRLMLSYEPGERPSAAQLVDIFEILAQNAKDTPLRKFCRTTVAEAKASEPELQTGDPLTGRVVDEDLSTAYSLVGGVPAMDSPPDGNTGTGNTGAQATGNSGAVSKPTPRPQPQSAPPDTSGPRSMPPSGGGASSSVSLEDETGGGGGGGMMKFVLIGVVLLVLGVGALALVGVVVGVGVFSTSGTSVSGTTTTPVTTPEKPPEPEKPPAAALPKSEVTAKDERAGNRSATTLKASFPDGAEVTITNGVFKATWDGKSDFALGDLLEGSYRTNITPVGGAKIRNKSFDVVGKKKKGCNFTFDAAKQEWTGGCE